MNLRIERPSIDSNTVQANSPALHKQNIKKEHLFSLKLVIGSCNVETRIQFKKFDQEDVSCLTST